MQENENLDKKRDEIIKKVTINFRSKVAEEFSRPQARLCEALIDFVSERYGNNNEEKRYIANLVHKIIQEECESTKNKIVEDNKGKLLDDKGDKQINGKDIENLYSEIKSKIISDMIKMNKITNRDMEIELSNRFDQRLKETGAIKLKDNMKDWLSADLKAWSRKMVDELNNLQGQKSQPKSELDKNPLDDPFDWHEQNDNNEKVAEQRAREEAETQRARAEAEQRARMEAEAQRAIEAQRARAEAEQRAFQDFQARMSMQPPKTNQVYKQQNGRIEQPRTSQIPKQQNVNQNSRQGMQFGSRNGRIEQPQINQEPKQQGVKMNLIQEIEHLGGIGAVIGKDKEINSPVSYIEWMSETLKTGMNNRGKNSYVYEIRGQEENQKISENLIGKVELIKRDIANRKIGDYVSDKGLINYMVDEIQNFERESDIEFRKELYTKVQVQINELKSQKYKVEMENAQNEKVGFFGRLTGKQALKEARVENARLKKMLADKRKKMPLEMPENYSEVDIMADIFEFAQSELGVPPNDEMSQRLPGNLGVLFNRMKKNVYIKNEDKTYRDVSIDDLKESINKRQDQRALAVNGKQGGIFTRNRKELNFLKAENQKINQDIMDQGYANDINRTIKIPKSNEIAYNIGKSLDQMQSIIRGDNTQVRQQVNQRQTADRYNRTR